LWGRSEDEYSIFGAKDAGQAAVILDRAAAA